MDEATRRFRTAHTNRMPVVLRDQDGTALAAVHPPLVLGGQDRPAPCPLKRLRVELRLLVRWLAEPLT